MSNNLADMDITVSNKYTHAVSLLSETFWLERWEDVFETLNEDLADGENPLMILYYKQSEENDRILEDLDREVSSYESSLENDYDEEDDFCTTMDKFEHFTGNTAWLLPAPLRIAVSDNTNSYAYPKWSDVKGDGVVVLDIFDGNMAWT